MLDINNKPVVAYIVGVSLGDGNLSNPNGRAVRLRISCDVKYPNIIKEIQEKISILAPKNKVSLVVRKGNCIDVSCYSNQWESLLGWKVGQKIEQKVSVPQWIKNDTEFTKACLKGLLQTDGCIYSDRGYLMINFVNCCRNLALDVISMIESLGFHSKLSTFQQKRTMKYTVRIATRTSEFINMINLYKN